MNDLAKQQRFVRGDTVLVKDGNFEAIVKGSYADLWGGSDRLRSFMIYNLHHNKNYKVAWFEEDEFTLIKPRCIESLDKLDLPNDGDWERPS